ncbi:MAG: STT3 domain-containing protein, partial [Candidatus Thorarchaeota archaeon]
MSKFSKFKRSAGRFLRQVFHRPKAKISRGSVLIVVALVMIFIAALALRLEPMIDAQPLVRAFDPWFQLKVTEFVADNGYAAFFTWYDDTTWVPFGRDMTTTSYIGVPFTSAFFYWVANAMGIQVSVLYVSLVLPAFMGALTTIVAFFLGRELSNNTVGMLSALFLAFMPAFIQRTVAGFYDNEMIGVFAILLTLFFFTRSLKRGSAVSGVAAGL